MAEETVEYSDQYKIIILGQSGVGKTAIIDRYCRDLFQDNNDPTIGVQYRPKIIEINGKKVKLSIWDTAGQEKFRTITRQFYRNVDGVILVYNIAEKETLDALESFWIQELRDNATSQYQTIIVGNKSDLKDDPEFQDKIVPTEEGENVARRNATMFVEASALKNYGVQNAFEELVQRIMEAPRENDQAAPAQLKENDAASQGYCSC